VPGGLGIRLVFAKESLMSSTNIHALLIGRFDSAPVNKALGVTPEYNTEGEAACRRRRNPKLGELPAR
jgi:hypothetical protein